MKKAISILVATLMLLTSVSVFANVTRPEAITLDVGTKVDTTDVVITPAEENTAAYNTSCGDWYAMFDGNGMVGGYIAGVEGNEYITEGMKYDTALGSDNKNTGRWSLTSNTAKPILEIQLSAVAAINTIKWTEIRDLIGEYTLKFYNGEELVHTYSGAATTGNVTSANMVLRTVELDRGVSADKIVFQVTSVKGGNKPSIAEMEFWNKPKAPTATFADGSEITVTAGYEVDKAFDGIYYVAANRLKDRFVFNPYNDEGVCEKEIVISFDLGSNKTFNYAQLAEGACALGEIDVEVSTDGNVYNKVGTMPRLAEYIGDGKSSIESIHSVSFDSVTARYVKYVIKEVASLETLGVGSYTVAISEIELFNYPAVSGDAETVIYPALYRGTEYIGDATSIPRACNLNSNATIFNSSDETKEYILIGVLYGDNNLLSNLTYNTVTVEAGKTRTFSIPSIADVEDAEKQTVRFMVWDTKLAPLAEAVSVSR